MHFDLKDFYWFVGGDGTRAYSSKVRGFVAVDDPALLAWTADGSKPTRIDSIDDLIAVLREQNIPPYHHVRKSTIIGRLTDGQLAQAIAMLTVRQQERWRAPDQPAVNADDPETNAILTAVGADPAVVLAPE